MPKESQSSSQGSILALSLTGCLSVMAAIVLVFLTVGIAGNLIGIVAALFARGLRRILVDVWGADLTVVEREFTLVGVNPALDQFAEAAALIKKEAHEAAADAGQKLAEVHAA